MCICASAEAAECAQEPESACVSATRCWVVGQEGDREAGRDWAGSQGPGQETRLVFLIVKGSCLEDFKEQSQIWLLHHEKMILAEKCGRWRGKAGGKETR